MYGPFCILNTGQILTKNKSKDFWQLQKNKDKD